MTAAEIVAGIFLFLGCFVILSSAIGFLRLPDFYTRMHAAGKTDTLGQFLILAGLGVIALFGMEPIEVHAVVKMGLIAAFLMISTPSSTHAIAQAAHSAGLQPWQPPKVEPKVQPTPSKPSAEDAP